MFRGAMKQRNKAFRILSRSLIFQTNSAKAGTSTGEEKYTEGKRAELAEPL